MAVVGIAKNAPSWIYSSSESQHFGLRIGRVGLDSSSHLDALAQLPLDLLIARCPTEDLRLVHDLEEKSFRLMDCLVYYRVDLKKVSSPPLPEQIFARPPSAADKVRLTDITSLCFQNYMSHYHADPRLSPMKCSELYVKWILRSGFGASAEEEVRLLEDGGKIVAFASACLDSPKHASALLAGVHPGFRGRGLYQSLVGVGMRWALNRGARYFWASTQVTNVGVQRALSRIGFAPSHSVYTFHKWYDVNL